MVLVRLLKTTGILAALLGLGSAAVNECSSTNKCIRGESFCNYEYGNVGICEPCSLAACLDPQLSMVAKGVIDCFDSCGVTHADSLSGAPACRGYIIDRDAFIPGVGPFEVPCGSPYGDSWGPAEYQSNSCCNAQGRYFVGSGQIGGFDASYGSPGHFPICTSYVGALQALLCDPAQGRYIRTHPFTNQTALRVCRASCDAVFENCGLPGEVFPAWTTYQDGTTLCQEMWGGFSEYDPGTLGRPDGLPILGIDYILVVDTDCLGMVFPSDSVLEYHKKEMHFPDPPVCNASRGSIAGVVMVVVAGVAAACVCCGALTFVCLRLRHRDESSSGSTSAKADDTMKKEMPDEEDPPVAHAVPVEENLFYVPELASESPLVYRKVVAKNELETTKNETAPAVLAATDSVEVSLDNEKGKGNKIEALPAVLAPTSLADVLESSSDDEKKALESKKEAAPAVRLPSSLADFVEDSSDDEKKAVKDWIASNPSATATLAPDDVALALSKVSFSLERPEVAKILAEGIQKNGGSVTTAHILAAMEISDSIHDAAIAKSMARYVVDPENKEQVLQALRMSFFKDEVSKSFPVV